MALRSPPPVAGALLLLLLQPVLSLSPAPSNYDESSPFSNPKDQWEKLKDATLAGSISKKQNQLVGSSSAADSIATNEASPSWQWPWDRNKTDGGNSTDGGGGGNTSCSSHKSCSECASSSWGCHWCAHDDACHPIGSIHGCLVGVNCDSADGGNGTSGGGNGTDGGGNSTDGGGGEDKKHDNKTEAACASHKSCSECASSSWGCHWCAHDEACHSIGSVHGCLVGVDCNGTHGGNGTDGGGGGGGGDDKKQKNKTDTACASHKSCSECASSSWGCHWCAHDEACHPIGSIHGCIAGVNCYSNDRCTRKDPEPIEEFVFQDIGTMPLIVILSLSAFVLCCATCCLGVACCMRGTYEDYAELAVANADASVFLCEDIDSSDVEMRKRTVVVVGGDNEDESDGNDDENDDANVECLGGDDEGGEGGEYQALEDNEEGDDESRFTMARSAHTRMLSRRSNTQCMFNSCKVCYAVTVCIVAAFAVAGVVYSPKKPDYNVCNDAIAWKSIVDGMTSLKMEASFQLLMSIENPNHLEIDINMGSGNFKHDGAYVGSFNIPPTSIKAMAITDLLVSVTFTPDKWEALQLTAEYYKGTLSFMVDLDVVVKVPALGGFTYEAKFDNYKVLANDPKLQDRHLCMCQKGGKQEDSPKTTGPLPITDH